jgi:GNAT superfamily N-acetyltransferase
MSVRVQVVQNRGELREFIGLPFRIHRGHHRWVPPLYSEERRYFDAKRNPAFAKNDTVLALAYANGVVVGRIMGIINRQYNHRLGQRHARFGYFECLDDPGVAAALLSHVEDWARKLGMEKIVGPMGFTEQDPEGFLIEGFQYESTIATYFNFEYLPSLLERNGYTKEVDYVVYLLDLSAEMPPAYERIGQRVLERIGCQVLEFTSRKALKPYIRPVLSLMNETFIDLYGYDPLEASEMDALATRYLPVIDPRFVKAAAKDGQLIAFLLAIPNLSEGFRQAKGRLLPFGFLKIMAAAHRTKQLDLLLAGVKKEYRGKGLDALGMTLLIREARQAGFLWMDSHHELEMNVAVRAEMERLGGRLYKRFRIFQKPLVRG